MLAVCGEPVSIVIDAKKIIFIVLEVPVLRLSIFSQPRQLRYGFGEMPWQVTMVYPS
jgi:hypothetical protein